MHQRFIPLILCLAAIACHHSNSPITMSLDAPPSVFTPPTAAPTAQTVIGPAAMTPNTPPVTPAPAAAAPAAIGAVFAAATAAPTAQTVIGPAAVTPNTPPVTPSPAAAAPAAIGAVFAAPAVSEPAYASYLDTYVLWTAAVFGGEGNKVHIARPYATGDHTPYITVSGQSVDIYPATFANMVVSGVSTAGVNGTYPYRGTVEGMHMWGDYVLVGGLPVSGTVVASAPAGGSHVVQHYVASVINYNAANSSTYTWPNVSGYVRDIGSGTAVVTALGTTDAQVIALVAATPAAAALVVGSAVGEVSTNASITPGFFLAGGGLTPPAIITAAAATPVTPAIITP